MTMEGCDDSPEYLAATAAYRFMINGVEYVPCLKWTREKPAVPGDYHLRGGKWASVRPIIVRLEWLAENLVVSFGNTLLGRLDRYKDGEWAGPIPLPAEPDEERHAESEA